MFIFIVSSVIQFDNTYFLQPRDNPFISCVIRSPTNLYALQYSRLRAKGTDKPVACLGRAGPARAERNDSSSREVMCCEERADGRCGSFHPDRITDEYHVIRREVFDIRCQRRAISGCHFFPDLCQQSIIIIGISIGRLNFHKVALYRVMDVSGNRPGITRMGEIDNQHFFVPGRFDWLFRFSTGGVVDSSV